MRERLFSLVQKAEPGDRLSKAYDIFIVLVAFISVVPLMFKGTTAVLDTIDLITVYILFADYVFRWVTCDYRSKSKSVWAFVKYPFTPYALLLLLSMLPSLGLVSHGFRVLRLFRITVVFQYSENLRHIARVFQKEKKTLVSVLYIAIFYIFLSALIMFAYEPENFDNFFEATYWATTALTTVGYGDVFPVSTVGKLISMISSLFGIAVIALPAGIVTAGFVDEINKGERAKRQAAEKALAQRISAGGTQPLFNVTAKVKRYALVMAASVLVNLLLNVISQYFKLPLWLDVTGTAFAALLLEPAAGLLVGLATNLFFAVVEYGPSSLLYYSSSAAVAVLAGVFLKKEGILQPKRVAACIALVIAITTLLAGGTELCISWGSAPGNAWERYYYEFADGWGLPYIAAFFFGHLVVKVYDTLSSAVLVALLYLLWPKKRV
ncbi:ion transporter [Ruminococcaceae bacterium OttesenSCG-928-I18]|nr:ion transporter [Ruminococcaceae bacterium OttesenSCG-928-I18]